MYVRQGCRYHDHVAGWAPPPLPPHWSSPGRPEFVGRRAELTKLADAWSAATRCARQLVFVGGEAGAGKSRLLAEVAAAAQQQGAAVLVGTCIADFGAPYQPFLEPVDALLPGVANGQLTSASADPVAPESAGADRSRWAERLTILADRHGLGVSADSEREHRRELYDAACAALQAAAEQRPVLLALEDVHWASTAALQLLRHIVQRTAHTRLLVVATHRTTAPEHSPALVHDIAELYRLDGVQRLDLAGLDVDDIADYLVKEAGLPVHRAPRYARRLHDQTAGNPFFLRELWRDLAGRGGLAALRQTNLQVPASVRDTIEGRLNRLAAPHRQTLELAAVMGEDVDIATLVDAAAWSSDTTLTALDEAVACGLLEWPSGSESTARFPHALARQAVLDLLPPSRRAQEHARLAQVLEQRLHGGGRQVQRVAHHYANAIGLGFQDKAVRYLTEAARWADRSLAHEDAGAWYELAASLSEAPDRRDELQHAAARSHLLGGNFARARLLDEQVATSVGSPHRLQAAIGYEAASWRPGLPGHRAVELLRDALAGVQHKPTDLDYVRALASLGRALAFTGATHEAGRLGAQAIELARALDDDDLLAHALQASLWHGLRPQDAPAKLARATELSQLVEHTGDMGQLGPAAYYRAIISYLQGEPAGLDAAGDDLTRSARATGQGFYDYMAGCVRYGRQFMGGDFAAADRTCRELLQLGESFGTDDTEGPYGVQTYMIRRETGALEQVRGLVTGQERPTEHWAPGLLALYTELALDEPAARLMWWLLDESLPRFQNSAQWPAVLAFLVEASLHLDDQAAARRLRPLLAEYAGLNLVAGQFVALFGSADRYLGAADSLLGFGEPEESFAAALEMDTRMGAPVHRAQTLAAQAVHRSRRGDANGDVEELARRVRSIGEPLGLVRVMRQLPGPGRPPATAVRSSDLTAREVDVLRLLGDGLINREIAERLVISENTAANHVRSILTKTGCANRTQAAMYAVTNGLLD
ncbi:hypothetical protein BH20ACT6_BH20ACT6_08790 [soil metagenome]